MEQKSHPDIPFSALILASGLSQRMGRPKALLPWDPATTFLEKILAEYLDAGCTQVICTVNRLVMPFCESMEPDPKVTFVLNEYPEWGRMHSVKLGLRQAGESPFCFIQNVDNPFIRAEVIGKILDARDPGAWISPEYRGQGGHPVLLPKIIIPHILADNNPESNLQETLRNFPRKTVQIGDDSILRNINTPEDYLKKI